MDQVLKKNKEIIMRFCHNLYRNIIFLFFLICAPLCIYGDHSSKEKDCKKDENLVYYLYIEDFANSFIQIPTSNVSIDSSTTASSYLAGRAPVYNKHNKKAGTCSASFLSMQNAAGIYTDISNYLSIDNGLIVSWFTPTKLLNLELDSIIHSMVTECIVKASTKVGFNPFYGTTFNMIVSSDDQKIYFKLHNIKN